MRAWIAVVFAVLMAMPVSLPAASVGAVPDCCAALGSDCHDTAAAARLECCTPASPQRPGGTPTLVRPAGDPRPLTAVLSALVTPAATASSVATASLALERRRPAPGEPPPPTVLRI